MNAIPGDATASSLFAPHALLPQGWAENVRLHWNAQGTLTKVQTAASPASGEPQAPGPLLPGLPNLHSHAFQRAFAGLTELRSAGESTVTGDNFWSWRERMYRVALAVSPEQLEHIATQLYIEMLLSGYTSVSEFHYLHHDVSGQPYADPAEMSLRLVAAARRAGIGLTLLPVLYQHGGFGAAPTSPQQRRFVHSVDGVLRLVERLRADRVPVGVAPHSLRAVGPEALAALLQGLHAMDPLAPVHIHVAEQQQEVTDCLAWSGARPVKWLLDHAEVDARWCLVHATHLDADEVRRLAAAGATVGLCPTTEANLGDGLFDLPAFLGHGGRWGVGSDSHASVDAFEELRLLEYGQRLHLQRRNVLADAAHPQVADAMWLAACAGGERARGGERAARGAVGLSVGGRADFVMLATDGVHAGLTPAERLATAVFAPRTRATVCEVWVAGHRVVHAGIHPQADQACENFVAARRQLLASG
jgi:formimidoylglutamate deiminase